MQPDRWERIKDLFGTAIECSAEARERLLDDACAGDAELRAEVDSLLAAHDTESFIDRPAVNAAVLGTALMKDPAWIGRRLGPYRIVEEVGQGGMSEVYRAVRADEEYEKEVAVKVLRAGVDIDALLRHFRIEKQILARLDHPSIARLLDAGSTGDGQPFLVMDFVRGRPIDEYCGEHHLGVPQRLALFRALCGAVHYVHQHLMVHGDLKCSNILVTDDGAVKLLDFGIAKLLNPSPALSLPDTTVSGWIALTPEYASPEQSQGQPITTASDVYSLGVVLHCLLTGVLPDAASKRLRGELDSIVTMALQQEPEKRYSSVEQLSEDVRHYLAGFAVLAHGARVGYLMRKFVGRHKVSTAIAALLLLSLVGGVVATSWQAHVARAERARAERHSENVRKLADTLLFDVHEAIRDLPGATAARQTLVTNSLSYLDALSAEQTEGLALRRDLASAYEQVGDVQSTRLGDNTGSLASYRKALVIRSEVIAADPDDQAVRRQLVRNHGKLAEMSFFVDDLSAAFEYGDNMVRLAEEQARVNAFDVADQRNLANSYSILGWHHGMSGDADLGLSLLKKAEAIYERLARAEPANVRARRNLAVVYGRQGHVLRMAAKQYAESQKMQEKSFELLSAMTQADPLNADLRQLEAYALVGIGATMAKQGAARAGLERQLQAVNWLRTLLEADPKNDRARFDAALALSESGETLVTLGEMQRAEQHLTESLSILSKSVGASTPEMTLERALIAFTYFQLGRLHALRGTDRHMRREERARHCAQAQSWFEHSSPLLAATERSKTWHLYVAGLSAETSRLLGACRNLGA